MTAPEREGVAAEGTEQESLLGPRIVLGLILVVSALEIARGGGYSVVGPGTIPLVVAIGLVVLGALFAVRTTIRPDRDLAVMAAEEERVSDWQSVGLIGLALVVYALALDGVRLGATHVPGLGYPIATALLLPVLARVLGSRSPIRDVIVGIVVAAVIYVGFTQFLGVRLPGGPLEPLLP